MLELAGFNDVVRECWSTPIHGHPMFILAEKLKSVKKALIGLNQKNGNLTSNVSWERTALHSIQSQMSGLYSHPILRAKERDCTADLWKALNLEENLARQKARIQWLALGGRNTSFFSKCTFIYE